MDRSQVQGPAQQIGFSTSVDTARKQTYNTCSVIGTKRPYAQLTTTNPSARDDHVLAEVTNIASNRSNFKRPCIGSRDKCRFRASRIQNVTTAELQIPQIPEYTRRRAVHCTPGPSQNPLLSLSNPRYGLPANLVHNFASLGVNSIYPWQSSCLLGRGLLSGEKNLVYTAPTGGGKSLVADVLMLKRVIEDPGKKAILALPYVALVQEKLKWLRRAVDGVCKNVEQSDQTPDQHRRWRRNHTSVRVVGFFGGSKARATWADVDIAVCTIEKVDSLTSSDHYGPYKADTKVQANALVNTAIEDCTIDDLSIVVLDELHMIDDDHRGYLLELMATKLLSLQHGVQIVGMSATLSVGLLPPMDA